MGIVLFTWRRLFYQANIVVFIRLLGRCRWCQIYVYIQILLVLPFSRFSLFLKKKKIKYSFFVLFFNFWRKLFPNNGRLSLTVCYPVFTFKIRKNLNSLLGNDHLTSNRAGREGMGGVMFCLLKKIWIQILSHISPISIKFRKKKWLIVSKNLK